MNKPHGSMIYLMLLGVCLLGFARPAMALKLEDFKLTQVVPGNQWPEIHVKFDRAADTWNEVTGDDVIVKVDYEIEVKSAYALAPGSEISMSLDNMNEKIQLQSTNSNYGEVHSGRATLRSSGNATNEIKAAALATCQLIRSNRGKPSKEHRIKKRFRLSAWATAYNVGPLFTEENASRQIGVDVVLVCNEDPGWHEPFVPDSQDLANAPVTFRPISIQLFLTTYQNQVTHPNPGTSCKKLEVKVRIETNKAGQLSYKLWRQPGEARSRTKFVEFQDSGPFKGRFVLEEKFVDTFDATTYVQYMAETASNPFGVSTQWKDINIQCSGPGGGFLPTPPGGGQPPAQRGLKAPTVTPPPPPVPPNKKAPSRPPAG